MSSSSDAGSDAAGHPPLADTPQQWPVLATEDLHRDHWVVALRADRVQRPGAPDEAPFRRVVMEHPGASVILAVDDRDRVLCLWQYRHPAGLRLVELPAGLLDGDADEAPLEVARRELREEAQLQAASWTHLTSSWSSPGISQEVAHCYLARDLAPADRGDFALAHEEADMVAAWVPFEELYSAVVAGAVADGPTAICVLLARARGLV